MPYILQRVGLCRSCLLPSRKVRWPRRTLFMVNNGGYADGTDADRYTALSGRRGLGNNTLTRFRPNGT